jgi:hypothetical protein
MKTATSGSTTPPTFRFAPASLKMAHRWSLSGSTPLRLRLLSRKKRINSWKRSMNTRKRPRGNRVAVSIGSLGSWKTITQGSRMSWVLKRLKRCWLQSRMAKTMMY